MNETTAIRLEAGVREKLEEIGRPYHMKASALIRLSIDQLIAATKANGGQLPPAIEALQQEETFVEPAEAALSTR